MNGRLPWLIYIAKRTYGKFLTLSGKVRLDNVCGADLKKGPYLMLLNHAGILDPVMVSAVMPRHVRWVAGAYLFKSFFIRFIIEKCCTAIAKQQGRSDISMVKNVRRALREGDSVGLFPEGTRTWDGNMVPYSSHTLARLLKYCKVPVLIIQLQGAYAANPRWADFKRKGTVTVKIRELISAESIASAAVTDLEYHVEKSLAFSNDRWKRRAEYNYVSSRRAEGIQRLLYICPSCHGIDTIRAKGNIITCSACNLQAKLNDKDSLESSSLRFQTLAKWHEWEANELVNISSFPKEKGVLFQVGNADNRGKLTTVSKNFTLSLRNNALRIKCSRDNVYVLPLSNITSFVLNAKQTMELFCDDVLYRVRLRYTACSLKYQEYYNLYVRTRGMYNELYSQFT